MKRRGQERHSTQGRCHMVTEAESNWSNAFISQVKPRVQKLLEDGRVKEGFSLRAFRKSMDLPTP
jgi:hypothetical protein